MIYKGTNRRQPHAGAIKRLHDYVADPRKADLVVYDNLIDERTAALVMQAVADRNTRVQDPLYHGILSWPAADRPNDEQMVDSARTLLKELGFQDHHAVLAVHRNTPQHHIHIAVLRIHPETLKGHSPYNDWLTADRVCREMELKHGFSHDRGPHEVDLSKPEPAVVLRNRDPGVTRPARVSEAAKAYERSTGDNSFQTRVAQGPAAAVRAAKDWAEVHRALADCGVAIEAKGSGYILRDRADPDAVAKFSHMGLGGISKLEKRLGAYTPAPPPPTLASHAQAPTPLIAAIPPVDRQTTNTAGPQNPSPQAAKPTQAKLQAKAMHSPELMHLHAEFDALLAARRARQAARTQGLIDQRARVKAQRAAIQAELLEMRDRLRAAQAPAPTGHSKAGTRRHINSMIAQERAKRRAEIRRAREDMRAALPVPGPLPRWDAFLASRAHAGDPTAADAHARLARRGDRKPASAPPTLSGQRGPDRVHPTPARLLADMTVHRDRFGALSYRWGSETALRDTGRAIQIVSSADDAARAALILASAKYGKLTASGDEASKQQIVRIAAAEGLAHRITNPELQVSIRTAMARLHPDPTDTTPPPAAQLLRAAHIERHPMHQHAEALRQIPATPLTPDQALARRRADDARRAKPPATPPTPTADRPAADTRPAAPPGVSAAIPRARARGRDR